MDGEAPFSFAGNFFNNDRRNNTTITRNTRTPVTHLVTKAVRKRQQSRETASQNAKKKINRREVALPTPWEAHRRKQSEVWALVSTAQRGQRGDSSSYTIDTTRANRALRTRSPMFYSGSCSPLLRLATGTRKLLSRASPKPTKAFSISGVTVERF